MRMPAIYDGQPHVGSVSVGKKGGFVAFDVSGARLDLKPVSVRAVLAVSRGRPATTLPARIV